MNEPMESAFEKEIREGERWLRQHVETCGDVPAPDLAGVKDRTRREMVESPEGGHSLPPPAPELIAQIKRRVRAELARAAGPSAATPLRPRSARRIRRFVTGGLAAAAAVVLVVWVGEGDRGDRPQARPSPDVSGLSDFAVVLEEATDVDRLAESSPSSSTAAGGGAGTGYLPEDPWFDDEVEALDEAMDLLLTDAWISDDVG